MGTTYYVDPTDGGSNVGTEANPWQSLKDAIDGTGGSQPAAGDLVICISANTGGADTSVDETPSSKIDVNGSATGSQAGGYLTFRGVNSSGSDDGSRYHITGTGLGAGEDVLAIAVGIHYVRFENFRLSYAPGDCATYNTSGGGDYCIWDNCRFDHATTYGIELYKSSFGRYERCLFDNNSDDGAHYATYAGTHIFEYCTFADNGDYGLLTSQYAEALIVVGCVFVGNTDYALSLSGDTNYVLNCVFASNSSSGISINDNANQVVIRGCRFAYNGAYGIAADSAYADFIEDYNVFYDNDTAELNNVTQGPNSLVASDATELGFTDHESATWNRDFNLTTDAILRSTARGLPED
jgi:hypothetical protein